MELDIAWFVVLTILGAACAARSAFLMAEPASARPAGGMDNGAGAWMIGSLFSLAMALVSSNNSTIAPLYNWLLRVLPNQGTDIHHATTVVLTGVACLVFVMVSSAAGLVALSVGRQAVALSGLRQKRRKETISENHLGQNRKKIDKDAADSIIGQLSGAKNLLAQGRSYGVRVVVTREAMKGLMESTHPDAAYIVANLKVDDSVSV